MFPVNWICINFFQEQELFYSFDGYVSLGDKIITLKAIHFLKTRMSVNFPFCLSWDLISRHWSYLYLVTSGLLCYVCCVFNGHWNKLAKANTKVDIHILHQVNNKSHFEGFMCIQSPVMIIQSHKNSCKTLSVLGLWMTFTGLWMTITGLWMTITGLWMTITRLWMNTRLDKMGWITIQINIGKW